MSMGIYKITNLFNGKVYIGQSIHIERRWKEHCFFSANSLIGKAIQKYGKQNFSFEILEEVQDEEALNELETKYIKFFSSLAPKGYNIVLSDKREGHHQFNHYSPEILSEIIDMIKNTSTPFSEIANKYNLSKRMIYFLNNGDFHRKPSESYPLRTFSKPSKNYCISCGKEISRRASQCSNCLHLSQRITIRPSREELKELIYTTPFTSIGKMYGVTDNTIRKWCKAYGLPSKVREIKDYSEEDWKKV